MNNVNKAIGYTSVFCVSFGIFYYLSYIERSTENIQANVSNDQAVSAHKSVVSYDVKQDLASVNSITVPADEEAKVANANTQDAARMSSDTEPDTRSEMDNIKHKAGLKDRSRSSYAINSLNDETPVYNSSGQEHGYTVSDEYNQSEMITGATAPSVSFTSSSVTSSGIDTSPVSTAPATSSLISTGDGSEFLPTGASQEDLFNSQLKEPRKFTLADYQKADITCYQTYGEAEGHGELMRNLKGC